MPPTKNRKIKIPWIGNSPDLLRLGLLKIHEALQWDFGIKFITAQNKYLLFYVVQPSFDII